MNEATNPLSDHPFWLAVSDGDVSVAAALLDDEPSLVDRDFRKIEEQDPHTNGFPLVKASETGNLEMVSLLLDRGADIDAKSHCEEQRELGAPIMLAFEQRRYDLIHYLLDRGASVAAYGWCYPSLVDLSYEDALAFGNAHEIARQGFVEYLGETDAPEVLSDDAAEALKLFVRLIDMGGQPSVKAIVELRNYETAELLLRTCPEKASTIHDYPKGSVFESLCWSAAWHGIPRALTMAMELCPHLYTVKMSLDVLNSAVKSHNREGLASEYFELIETQLKFLQKLKELESVIDGNHFLPHFQLAANYLWPGWCGNEKDPSTVKSMIELSRLFFRYGFDNVNSVDSESNETALARARSRSEHPGLSDFADYLASVGGK